MEFVNSQIFLIPATFLFGGVIYIVEKKARCILDCLGYLVAVGIFFSFLFDIGETYSYTAFYKRAFFIYSDNITTILALLFLFAVTSSKKILGALTVGAIFMSGGKIGIVLLLICIALLLWIKNGELNSLIIKFFSYFLLGALLYVSMLFTSGILYRVGLTEVIQSSVDSFANLRTSNGYGLLGAPIYNTGACQPDEICILQQAKAALRQRYLSSAAGLWMTLKGGYRGTDVSRTADDFAIFMMKVNPWEINNTYGLEYMDWKRIGSVQNPYLRFGSLAGPWFLLLPVIGLSTIGFVGVENIKAGEVVPGLVFTIYYLVIIIFNQTQPWLMGKNMILVALGFGGAHILTTWYAQHKTKL